MRRGRARQPLWRRKSHAVLPVDLELAFRRAFFTRWPRARRYGSDRGRQDCSKRVQFQADFPKVSAHRSLFSQPSLRGSRVVKEVAHVEDNSRRTYAKLYTVILGDRTCRRLAWIRDGKRSRSPGSKDLLRGVSDLVYCEPGSWAWANKNLTRGETKSHLMESGDTSLKAVLCAELARLRMAVRARDLQRKEATA